MLQAVQYLERLLVVQDAAASALLTLGDGNWKMGEGAQVGGKTKAAEVDEQTVLEHFTCASAVRPAFSPQASLLTASTARPPPPAQTTW